jgi:hypothetical protein
VDRRLKVGTGIGILLVGAIAFTKTARPVWADPSELTGTQLPIVDQTEQSPEFAQFLDQVRQAVRDRNAEFINSIITPYTLFGTNGDLIRFENFDLANPTDPFWFYMERALSSGCSIETNSLQPLWESSSTWLCPSALTAFDAVLRQSLNERGFTPYQEYIVVLEQEVSVRTQPDINSPVVQTLSTEIVRWDRQTHQTTPFQVQRIFNFNNPVGWIPVILSDGQSGYIPAQDAYLPIGTRAIFAEMGGSLKLQMLVLVD